MPIPLSLGHVVADHLVASRTVPVAFTSIFAGDERLFLGCAVGEELAGKGEHVVGQVGGNFVIYKVEESVIQAR